MNVFTASFGAVPVRFVYLADRGALFVSKEDIYAAVRGCWVAKIPFDGLPGVGDVISHFADQSEKSSAVLDVDTIGSVVNAFSAGNMMLNFATMTYVPIPDVRESAFRISSLYKWYGLVLNDAINFFGIGFVDAVNMAKDHLDKHVPALLVSIVEVEGVWIAECDALGLVTEADSFEALRDRVWDIAPELAVLNEVNIPVESLRLQFTFADSASQHQTAA